MSGPSSRILALLWALVHLASGRPALAKGGLGLSHELRWFPDGSRLVVDERWLLDPERRRFSRLGCAPAGEPPVKDCQSVSVAVSRDGASIAVVANDWVATGPPEGPLGAKVLLPDWLGLSATDKEYQRTNAFWVSRETLLVQETDKREPLKPQCRLLEVETGRWRAPPGGCLESGLQYLGLVEPGPGNWIAIYSSGEGANDLTLSRYDPQTGQAKDAGPDLTTEPPGALSARFRPDGSRVDIIAQCPLGPRRPPCFDRREPARWRLYSWPLRGGPLTLERRDLPPGAEADPRKDRFAWTRGNTVCVGDYRKRNAPCLPLPE